MKRLFLVAAVAVLVGGWTVASLQRYDLAGNLSGDETLKPAVRANTAATGEWVDVSGFTAVVFAVATGIVEPTGNTYVIVQDSLSGAAVVTRDSFAIAAAADSSYIDYNYQGPGRWVRALQRASGAAGDTVETAILIFGTPRAR